ncbi:carbon storage regulator CsrA [Lysinibacillus sp. BW-2-10]|uniref:carbon storage regulator CsrA n=1 Tax=Lysinibacillus sp. BW-2-10 TaxID=2590030 RepID=UPI00117F392D|nr:carbon storage regulator CsrA [Lysinibacillus sp. BW-2-10]TSI07326.1 carbon storage regulator CsrA [Lysinibacillus sp. BW-2-10]
MLILSRKAGETIWIGEDVEIIISEVKGEQVKIGIRAPRNIDIIRGELRQDISTSNTESVVKNLSLFTNENNRKQ